MTFDHDAREQKREPQRQQTPEQREAIRALEQDAELRQLATDALLIHENPERQLRRDLQKPQMTNVEYAAAAKHVMMEREAMARDLQKRAIEAYAEQPGRMGEGAPSIVDQLKTANPDLEFEVPTFYENERLVYDGMADVRDIARAGVSFPKHREILENGIPLQSKTQMDVVIGLPPGDLEMNRQNLREMRQTQPTMNGFAKYRIVKD